MEKIAEPDAVELKKFALTLAVTIAFLFGLLLPWIFDRIFPLWPWIVSLIVLTWCLCAPTSFKVIYKLWMAFGQVMNRISNFVLLGIIYYVVITPLGFFLRRGGETQIHLDFDKTADSYRVSNNLPHKDNLKRPF